MAKRTLALEALKSVARFQKMIIKRVFRAFIRLGIKCTLAFLNSKKEKNKKTKNQENIYNYFTIIGQSSI